MSLSRRPGNARAHHGTAQRGTAMGAVRGAKPRTAPMARRGATGHGAQRGSGRGGVGGG